MSAFRDDTPSQMHPNVNCVNTDTDLYKAEVSDEEDEANRKTNMLDTKEVPGM